MAQTCLRAAEVVSCPHNAPAPLKHLSSGGQKDAKACLERWGPRSREPQRPRLTRASGVHLQVYETLADRKLHLLFELWDKDGDGSISFAELALGLRKFSSPAEPCTETAADAAEVSTLPLASVTQSSPVTT